MLEVAWWLFQHWYLVLFVGAIFVAYIVGGWRLALAVASLGIGGLLYRKGQADEHARVRRQAEHARKHRDAVELGVGAMGAEDVQREVSRWNRD